MKQTFAWSLLLLLATGSAIAQRSTISLDGKWQVAQGEMEAEPDHYVATVTVPGLVDQAWPPFSKVGIPSADREAFWYKCTFVVAGAVPERAVLKLHKAAYTSRVYLNGSLVGDHSGSFTPGFFDVHPFLKGEGSTNTLVVRVGATRDQVPEGVPDGYDVEKVIYQPGIYDSVELIMSDLPAIENVQVVPDIREGSARLVAEVRGVAGTTFSLGCEVNGVRTGKEEAKGQVEAVIGPDGTAIVDTVLRLKNPRLWTPEDPFLYELSASTGADSFKTRFGLRTFGFDPVSGQALLNDKPYMMRGTNVCIFRFFEDSMRGSRPWEKVWPRQLHQAFKDMHWNSIRYCIGFPPSAWYDIADEEGFLIQDEFPIWEGRKPKQDFGVEEVAKQYREWMREHWNHPSVVIWDAQNETVTTVTGAAIERVRALDLSERPWDNGWGPDRSPGDSFESHPYVFSNPNARLSMLAHLDENHVGSPQKHESNAMILNEYGWLWLNRDGSPCTLTAKLYENLLGTSATAEQRFELYGRYLAELTEYWRSTRRFAAVMHFCGLSYSRPGGQTSDNFTDVQNLRFEPKFYRYVRDAFSPVGVCINFYHEELMHGGPQVVPVSVINDNQFASTCTVKLRLLMDGKELQAVDEEFHLQPLEKREILTEMSLPEKPGHYQLEATLSATAQADVRSLRDFKILSPEEKGIATRATVSASSELTKGKTTYKAAYAVDGDAGTRWSSDWSDGQQITLDLKEPMQVGRVQLNWEKASAKEFALETSVDGTSWTEVYHEMAGRGGQEQLSFSPVQARYIRLRGLKRATEFGYSLWEMRVFRD